MKGAVEAKESSSMKSKNELKSDVIRYYEKAMTKEIMKSKGEELKLNDFSEGKT